MLLCQLKCISYFPFKGASYMRFSLLIGAVAATISISGTGHTQDQAGEDWPICGYGKRITCVVDGDTFWMQGQKYRVYGVDAPEAGEGARCEKERKKAEEATRLLQYVLQSSGLKFTTHGTDRYGRTLVSVRANQGDAEVALIKSNLAVPYEGGRRDPMQWCR
ncbi:thermonuclease family protein [Sinorhizobium fredii]|uniref:thermonuclease family protein n=1 Tax=Rhizobium fredii TaxID=380 RepID=UPI003514F307